MSSCICIKPLMVRDITQGRERRGISYRSGNQVHMWPCSSPEFKVLQEV